MAMRVNEYRVYKGIEFKKVVPERLIQFRGDADGRFSSARLIRPDRIAASFGVGSVDAVASASRVSDEMILIKAGSFPVKGSELFGGNKPAAERITISKDFELGKYPVTVAEFREFVEAAGYLNKISGQQGADELRELLSDHSMDRHPVVWVNKDDRRAYAAWKGEGYYIPTAAEWEYAARGNEGRLFPYGNDWREAPYYMADKTFPVDSFPEGATPEGVSGFGIVWEATSTYYDSYDPKLTTDPRGPKSGDSIEVRGGSAWGNDQGYFHGANRSGDNPVYRRNLLGFRVAKRTLS
jgi:formylglycine-generating enzyme required for sulfatase activity